MTATTIETQKLHLIEWVMRMDDKDMMQYLLSLSESQTSDWWFNLKETDRDSILRGLEDAKQGRTTPAEEVFARLSQKYA